MFPVTERAPAIEPSPAQFKEVRKPVTLIVLQLRVFIVIFVALVSVACFNANVVSVCAIVYVVAWSAFKAIVDTLAFPTSKALILLESRDEISDT